MRLSIDQQFAFHEEGKRKFPVQWVLFCETLIAKGADVQLANLICSLPNGVDVVHALFIDPAGMSELVALKTRRARAAWLQRLSTALEAKRTQARQGNTTATIQ